MDKSYSEAYKAAGVDVTAGYRAVELMRKHVERTTTPGVLSGLGGFGGLFAPDLGGMREPVLVSGTDGVGTKLRLAFLMDRHDTVGIDCVAMCVNDIVCSGARPLFFLDYLAMGRNVPERVEQIVAGVAEGCVQAGCALIGGESAEMPGFYPPEEYDLAGFAVGVVDREKILDPMQVHDGDAIIALPSSGVHSNGFSLVRKVFDIDAKGVDQRLDGLPGTLGEALLTPTKIYVKAALALMEAVELHALCHITGGGFYENIPRALPLGMSASIRMRDVRVPAIFDLIQRTGNISTHDMYNTFNMGVGMCAILPAAQAERAVAVLEGCGEAAWLLGHVKAGTEGVELL